MKRPPLLLFLAVGFLFTNHLFATTLWVATNGNDQWSGLLASPNNDLSDGPLASLSGAQKAVKKLQPTHEPVTILVADGTYRLEKPLVFTPDDSGTSTCPITYSAAPGAKPVLSGGLFVLDWRAEPDGTFSAAVPTVNGVPYLTFEQLWIEGRRAIRAREPGRLLFPVVGVKEEVIEPGVGGVKQAKKAKEVIQASPADVECLSGLSANELKDVEILLFSRWDTIRRHIDTIDFEKGTLTIEGTGMPPWNQLDNNTTFILDNVRAGLDLPGSWYLDKEQGRVFYRPLIDQTATADPHKLRAEIPFLEHLVLFKGDQASGRYVEQMAFRGLAFECTQWLMPPEGVAPVQAAVQFGAAIEADDARLITFENCRISHTGGYGIWFRQNCSNDKITHCLLDDLGAGGIRIGEQTIRDEPFVTKKIIIDNNIIRHGGRVAPAGVGLWVGQSCQNVISHNEFFDFYYTAISLGWTWGYKPSVANNNLVEFNRMHLLGQGVLSDLGAVYTLGISPGTVVQDNVAYDIDAAVYGGWGLYTDEGSSNILFKNNLVYNTLDGGFHQHYGKDNVLINNIFAFGKEAQVKRTLAETHSSFSFEHNIVYWNQGKFLIGKWKDKQLLMDDNLYWDASRRPVLFDGLTLQSWRVTGKDAGSIIADPMFTDPDHGNFHIESESPAFKIGFVPFDYSKAGLYGDPSWINEALNEKPDHYFEAEHKPEDKNKL